MQRWVHGELGVKFESTLKVEMYHVSARLDRVPSAQLGGVVRKQPETAAGRRAARRTATVYAVGIAHGSHFLEVNTPWPTRAWLQSYGVEDGEEDGAGGRLVD